MFRGPARSSSVIPCVMIFLTHSDVIINDFNSSAISQISHTVPRTKQLWELTSSMNLPITCTDPETTHHYFCRLLQHFSRFALSPSYLLLVCLSKSSIIIPISLIIFKMTKHDNFWKTWFGITYAIKPHTHILLSASWKHGPS